MRTEDRIKAAARDLGFALAGIARATEADGFERLREWLARGYAGEMAYMGRYAEERRHPASVLPEVRSVVMVAMEYGDCGLRIADCGLEENPQSAIRNPQSGKIARYAAGPDYHDVVRDRLNRLLRWVQSELPGTRGRGVVDTAPLLERDFARRAGLGWIGKNTLLINKHRGSYFFLGALLLAMELKPEQ